MSSPVLKKISIDNLTPHPADPFLPYTDAKLKELSDSILKIGQLDPILVRPRWKGGYEILAGKNRVNAVRLNGGTEIDAFIMDADDDEAEIIVTDSNLQHRQVLLPSERAFAYRAQAEALSRQGKRGDIDIGGQGQINGRSKPTVEIIAEKYGVGKNYIKRHIRLTYLIPEFIALVDSGLLPLYAGVDISYLEIRLQQGIYNFVNEDHIKMLNAGNIKKIKHAYNNKKMPFTLQVIGKLIQPPPLRKPFKINRALINSVAEYSWSDKKLEWMFLAFLSEKYKISMTSSSDNAF
jgi:ParB family chromosome partitioning protein